MDTQKDKSLQRLLTACLDGDRHSQDELYKMFYGYAMSICLRYSRDKEEAIEIVNDGFLKIFTKISKYTLGLSFKGWLRKIMVHSAIDHYRRNGKHHHYVDIAYARRESSEEDALDKISEKEIIAAIQELSPSYRIVFNLFAIEGYKHKEIAQKLDISVGTSKSNMAMARTRLKYKLAVMRKQNVRSHG